MGTPNIVLPISEASAREIDLVPTWRYAGCYSQALQLLQSSSFPIARLITHRFEGIEKVPLALQTACMSMDSERKMVVKVAVTSEA
jgi:L-iditol 2-dehydrogenase